MSTYHPVAPISHHGGFPQSITALSFDPVSDVLWAGLNSGNIEAHYGSHAMRGVNFHVGGTLAVKKIIAGANYIRAVGVSSGGVGSWSKGGMNKWFHRSSVTCTTFSNVSDSGHSMAISTTTPELLLLNSMTGNVVRQSMTPAMITHLHHSHSALVSGALDGYLRLYDQRTALKREDSIVKAHFSGIQGLECSGNFVFTIGYGVPRYARPFPDPLVKVYDLRMMRALPPVPFSAGPAFINVIPGRPSTIAIASNTGLVNIVDVSNPNTASEFYQLDAPAQLTSMAVSPTAAYLAFGDSEGAIHMLSAADENELLPFNGFDGQPSEWADTPEPLLDIQFTDSTPLNSIGLPYYSTRLLSSWTPKFMSSSNNFPPPAKIPIQILTTMKTNDTVAYAALPKELKGRRNMITNGPRKNNGRFRSGKTRSDVPDPETPLDYTGDDAPRTYRHVEIEYSKFGVEDFDFGFYNQTEFSGLETHILNSYTNPIVQLMHYSRPIRRLAKSHITTNCLREHCLLCELGFVVRMLEDAHGKNCQSSNFCKAVGVLATASNAIEIIDYGRELAEVDYARMIQAFHRFLIDHITTESNEFPFNASLFPQSPSPPGTKSLISAPITQLLGFDVKNIVICSNCKTVREKENMSHVVDLTYPRKPMPNEPTPPTDFETIVRNSIVYQPSHKTTCQTCKHYTTFTSMRPFTADDLPPILTINASVYNEDHLNIWLDWRTRRFLKPTVTIAGYAEGPSGEDIQTPGITYEVKAMVVQVASKSKSHLVAIVKVPEAEGRADLLSPWFVFNDFVVRNISEEEALSFPGKWKIPAVIYLERVGLEDLLDYSNLPSQIDDAILSRDTSISLNRDASQIKHECLSEDELPKPGTLVAIDAEFVSMQQGETEFRSDGTNKVLRPARLSLARVSVLRGNGPKEGVPLIDDHIHTSETIVDYLTEFSGIKFGDLDPRISPYTLTPLKLVYKKLRLLVDRGCIFIGHGLSKDFRIINIFVPPEQVIDTVDLYWIKARHRRLSLRFLSWFVLQEHIQTDTHDSIEDARSALLLYKEYHKFETEGTFDQKLEELYKFGKQCNFKAPVAPGAASSQPMTTSASMPALSFALPIANSVSVPQMNVFQNRFPTSQTTGNFLQYGNSNWR